MNGQRQHGFQLAAAGNAFNAQAPAVQLYFQAGEEGQARGQVALYGVGADAGRGDGGRVEPGGHEGRFIGTGGREAAEVHRKAVNVPPQELRRRHEQFRRGVLAGALVEAGKFKGGVFGGKTAEGKSAQVMRAFLEEFHGVGALLVDLGARAVGEFQLAGAVEQGGEPALRADGREVGFRGRGRGAGAGGFAHHQEGAGRAGGSVGELYAGSFGGIGEAQASRVKVGVAAVNGHQAAAGRGAVAYHFQQFSGAVVLGRGQRQAAQRQAVKAERAHQPALAHGPEGQHKDQKVLARLVRRHYRQGHGERQQRRVQQRRVAAAHQPGQQQIRRPEPGGHHFTLLVGHEDGKIHPEQPGRAQHEQRQRRGAQAQAQVMPDAVVMPPQRHKAGQHGRAQEQVPGQVDHQAGEEAFKQVVARGRGQARQDKRGQRQGVQPEEAVREKAQAQHHGEGEGPLGVFELVGADIAGVHGRHQGHQRHLGRGAAGGLHNERHSQREGGAQPAGAVGPAAAYGQENGQGKHQQEEGVYQHQRQVKVRR